MAAATQYSPGENLEQVYVDENGQRFDEQGRPIITGGARSVSWTEPCFYTSHGQPLSYYAVYGQPLGLSPKVKYADTYPGPANVHQNVPLTDFAQAYEIDSGLFIGPQIAPIHTVQKRSDDFYKINQTQAEDMLRDEGDYAVRAVGGVANDVQQQHDTDNYQVVDYAFRDFLPDETADNADEVLQLQEQITTFLTTVLQLHFDYRLISSIFTTGNFSNETFTNAGGGQVGSASPSNTYIHDAFNKANIQIIRSNVMVGANTVVMNADVAQQISASEEIKDVVKHNIGDTYIQNGGFAGPNYGLPERLFGKRVVVVPHIENTAEKGATPSFSDKLTDNLIFLDVEAPGRRTRNGVTTFRKGGLNVRTYRDEHRKGTFIEAEMIQDEKITNSNAGYILTNALA